MDWPLMSDEGTNYTLNKFANKNMLLGSIIHELFAYD
jgi:hypothetical protein